jgi:hypothetical protein
MNRIALVLLFLVFCGILSGNAMQVNYADTTHCHLQAFDQKHLATYRRQHDFDYETIRPEGSGISSLLAYLLAEFFESLGRARVGHISLYDVLFYGLAIFASVMIVLQFFKINISGVLLKSPGTIISHQAFTENVHELNFDTLIGDALKSANYRLATRLYYLKTLKKLSDTGLINWQKNKTNFEYYYELKGAEQRKNFYHLTRLFESAWYGNADITATEFDENLKAFTGFLQTIKR